MMSSSDGKHVPYRAPSRVSRRYPGYCGMRADVEVGQRRATLPAMPSIGKECLLGQESGRIGQRLPVEVGYRDRIVEVFDRGEARRDLGIHDWAA